jgi:hypothetical protein
MISLIRNAFNFFSETVSCSLSSLYVNPVLSKSRKTFNTIVSTQYFFFFNLCWGLSPAAPRPLGGAPLLSLKTKRSPVYPVLRYLVCVSVRSGKNWWKWQIRRTGTETSAPDQIIQWGNMSKKSGIFCCTVAKTWKFAGRRIWKELTN